MATAGAAALLLCAKTASRQAPDPKTNNIDSANTAQKLTETSRTAPIPPASQATPRWPSTSGTPATSNDVLAQTPSARRMSVQADRVCSTVQDCSHRTRWERFAYGVCPSCSEVKGRIACTRCGLAICFKCQRKLLPHHSMSRRYGKRPGQPGYEGPHLK